MARRRYQHTTEGQEVQQADLNQVATEAALAEDYTLRELVRTFPNGDGRTADRGILPWTGTRPGGTVQDGEPTVRTADPLTKRVYVAPFRFVLGSQQAAISSLDDALAALDDNRSALFVDPGPDAPELELALGSDTVGNDRWTLVYATLFVDQDEPQVSRFVKDPVTGVATSTLISVSRRCQVQLAIVEGAEAASPVRPALPADGAGQFRLPLAYVYCPHPFTSSSVVQPEWIHDAAPVLPVTPGAGVASVLPAKGQWDPSGPIVANHTWDGTARPEPYLPATMGGALERLVQLKWEGADRSVPLSGGAVLDDSVDWRDRYFDTVIVVGDSAARKLASSRPSGATPDTVPGHDANTVGANLARLIGQSFTPDVGGFSIVAKVTPTELSAMGAGSSVAIRVNLSTGVLQCQVGAADPAVALWAWIRASGAFHQ